jgi:hypothetical protein
VDPKVDKDEEMDFQDAKRTLNSIYDHSDSESSADKHRKVLHIMFGAPGRFPPITSSSRGGSGWACP